ncbi:hypothetical protein FOA52_016073 [Chlamydomonas sp. UWO 241]|nr:hypothetical protein FOA52_016073 [Chlamydomonas sp. UWO 241]
MKSAPKPQRTKPKAHMFVGPITRSREPERVEPGADALAGAPRGWVPVVYSDAPMPAEKPVAELTKQFCTKWKKRRPLAGLTAAYKTGVAAELVPAGDDEEDLGSSGVYSAEERAALEAWLARAREARPPRAASESAGTEAVAADAMQE